MGDDGATQGSWTAMTTFSPLPFFWAFMWRVRWAVMNWLERHHIRSPNALIKLSMIGFARWSMVGEVRGFKRGDMTTLPRPYILFETNFNGDSDQYLEAFSLITTKGMQRVWRGTYGLPKIARVSAFIAFVNKNLLPISGYQCAYPQSSTKMVRSALLLKRLYEDFNASAPSLGPEHFLRAYSGFLAAAQQENPEQPRIRQAPKTSALTALAPVEGSPDDVKAALDKLPPRWAPAATHFARWVLVDKLQPFPGRRREIPHQPYLLFSAWFDGAPEPYLEELYERLGDSRQAILGPCGLKDGSAERFRRFLMDRCLKAGITFAAYDGVTVGESGAATDLSDRVWSFATTHHKLSAKGRPRDIQERW